MALRHHRVYLVPSPYVTDEEMLMQKGDHNVFKKFL